MDKVHFISNLKPIKAIIIGPPGSGKTKLSERLCRHYGAHYMNVRNMINETLEGLRDQIEKSENVLLQIEISKEKLKEIEGEISGEDQADNYEYSKNTAIIQECQDQINVIVKTLEKSKNNKLPDDMVTSLMKKFLLNETCQTRGYILDGYPKTVEQATEIFGESYMELDQTHESKTEVNTEEEEEKDHPDVIDAVEDNALIMPDFVVSLEASDEYLCQRIMKLPQKLIYGTHFDEVGMLRRLADYHENNQEDYSVLKFFDDNEINPLCIPLVEEDTLKEMTLDELYNFVCEIFGKPIPGFGVSLEEEEAIRKLEMEQLRLMEEEERLEKQLMEKKAKKEHEEKMEKWNETLEKLQIEEEKVLAAQNETLRYYLMKYIFPTLSKSLVEVAKVKPDDPVDFLAEYLFKENPEGKIFDPSYTPEGERILNQYEEEVKPIADLADVN